MTNDQPKAPMSDAEIEKLAIEHLPDKEGHYLITSLDRKIFVEAFKLGYSIKQNAGPVMSRLINFQKDQHEELRKELSDNMAEIDRLNEDLAAYKSVNMDIRKYLKLQNGENIIESFKELKAKADKMKEILKRLDPMLITDYLQDVIDEAIQEYESIDKVNKSK